MADSKQTSGISGGEEISEISMEMESEIDEKPPAPIDKTLRRTISAPSAEVTPSISDSVFSPMIYSSSFPRKGSLNGLETSSVSELVALSRIRPKSTSSCRSSSVSDDDQSLKLSPHATNRRSRTYSDSLNVDCSSTSPSPIPVGSPAPRVLQIRREESVDELTREVAKERDITSAINLSRSWDENLLLGENKRDSFDDLTFDPSSPALSSPVRFVDKLHCNRSLTPSPIGIPISPNNRKFRRSLSPSHLRPSLLSSKRKLDPDDPDSYCSPAKRSHFYAPSLISTHHLNHHHSLSSSFPSSPDHPSDSNSNHCSCDEDSGSEPAFAPHLRSSSLLTSHTPIGNPLSCDTRQSNSFAFVKPRHIAPQSPLALGINSNSNDPHRKATCPTSYTFTPVKDT